MLFLCLNFLNSFLNLKLQNIEKGYEDDNETSNMKELRIWAEKNRKVYAFYIMRVFFSIIDLISNPVAKTVEFYRTNIP